MKQKRLVNANLYKVANDQLDQVSDILQAELKRKQRALKVKEFLKRLAADPDVAELESDSNNRSLAEWLYITEYPIKQEMIYNYEKRRFESTNAQPQIDLAELLTLLLHKQGVDYTFEDLMDHILEGRTLANFLDARPAPIENRKAASQG